MKGSHICEECDFCISIGGEPICSCENGCAMEQRDIEEVYGKEEPEEHIPENLFEAMISGLLDE